MVACRTVFLTTPFWGSRTPSSEDLSPFLEGDAVNVMQGVYRV